MSERLDDILAAYLEAAERSWAPERERLLAAYPEHAADLARFLDNQEALTPLAAAIARNLRPGGLFVADYIPWLDEHSPPSTHHQLASAGGRRSAWRIRLDPRNGLSETRIVFREPGGDIVERHVQRHRRPAEASGLAVPPRDQDAPAHGPAQIHPPGEDSRRGAMRRGTQPFLGLFE